MLPEITNISTMIQSKYIDLQHIHHYNKHLSLNNNKYLIHDNPAKIKSRNNKKLFMKFDFSNTNNIKTQHSINHSHVSKSREKNFPLQKYINLLILAQIIHPFSLAIYIYDALSINEYGRQKNSICCTLKDLTQCLRFSYRKFSFLSMWCY